MAKRKSKLDQPSPAAPDRSGAPGQIEDETSPFDVPELAPPDRHQSIAVAAYFRAQARGFFEGHELDDWLAAERELMEASARARRSDEDASRHQAGAGSSMERELEARSSADDTPQSPSQRS
jgi:hypothetical protein